MKLIIDINEDDLTKAKQGRCPVSTMRKAIVNGTPLEEHCDGCEVGNPCLYCKHGFEEKVSDSEIPNKLLDKIKAELADVKADDMYKYVGDFQWGVDTVEAIINKYTAQEGESE